MKLRENAAFDIMTVSSMGVRITPMDRQPVHTSGMFQMQTTSAETNVLNISSSLGLNAKVLTRFVKDSPVAQFIKSELRRRNIAYEGQDIPQGGPWGYRHQFNIADSGFGLRGPRVQNDRAGEVGLTLTANDYDLDAIFSQGCRILHLSGLVAALSQSTTDCCLKIARKAKEYGTLISFDLNYRASFWVNREDELRKAFKEIASLSDILIGNEEDYQLALGIQGPEAGGEGIEEKIEDFKAMINCVKAEYPGASVFATTLREVNSANSHEWGAIMLYENEWFVGNLRTIPVLDRIGGGDGFVGGLLYAILREWAPEKWVKFGWATGALATTMLTDYATPVSEDQVWGIYEGNARVKR